MSGRILMPPSTCDDRRPDAVDVRSSTSGRPPSTRAAWFVAALIALGVALYAHTLHYEFVYDDDSFVVLNESIRSLKNLPAFFTEPGTLASDQELAHDNYRPLVTTSFALNYALGGLDPFGYRLFNLLLHILNSLLVFWLARRLFGRDSIAFVAAAIFLAHPVQVESVVFVSSRSNLLATAFFLGAWLVELNRKTSDHRAVRYRDEIEFRVRQFPIGELVSISNCSIARVLSLAFFSAALLCKELAIVLPAALLLWDGLFGDGWKRGLRRAAPYGVIAVAYFALRTHMLGHAAQTHYWAGGFYETMLTMSRGFATYVRLAVWPHPLSLEYLFDVSRSLSDWRVLASIGLLASLLALAIGNLRRRPALAFGILFFFLGLAPVSNLIPIKSVINERFMYVAVIGFAITAAEVLRVFSAETEKTSDLKRSTWHLTGVRDHLLSPRSKVFGLRCHSTLLLVFCALTMHRSLDWRTGLTLVQASLKTAPQSARMHYGLGRQYASRAEWENAAAEFKLCLQIDPTYDEASRDLVRLATEGKEDPVIFERFRKTLQTRVQVPETLFELGTVYVKSGDAAKAIPILEAAVRARPQNVEWRANLAAAYASGGRLTEAISLAKAIVAEHPEADKVARNLDRWQKASDGASSQVPLQPTAAALVRRYFPQMNEKVAHVTGSTFERTPAGLRLISDREARFQPGRPDFLLPERYGPTTIHAGPAAGVRMTPLGATAAVAENQDGLIVYPNVYPDVDVLYAVQPGEMEKLYLLKSSGARASFEYQLEGRGDVGAFRLSNGLLQALSKDGGRPLLELTPPVAFDAKGKRVTARFHLSESKTLALRLQTRMLTFPLLIDPTWRTAGAGVMVSSGSDRVSIVLPNGKALVFGGTHSQLLTKAELYDPAAGTWSSTGSLGTSRTGAAAVLLPNGTVLAAGGGTGAGLGQYLSTAEIYTPDTGAWTSTDSMLSVRYLCRAALLPNGKVLVAGGTDNAGTTLLTAEVYDPNAGSNRWSAVASMATGRGEFPLLPLTDGRVIAVGGSSTTYVSTVEIYDPTVNRWDATDSLRSGRRSFSATMLASGKVLVAGGYRYPPGEYLSSAELYDPAAGVWSTAGSMATGRAGLILARLPNGKAIAVGGTLNQGVDTPQSTTELYDPDTGSWSVQGSLATGRSNATSAFLTNGKLLVAGGTVLGATYVSTAEVYDPSIGSWSSTGSMSTARSSAAGVVLPDGRFLVIGPSINSGSELYDPVSGTWTTAAGMLTPYYGFSALLSTGKVLLVPNSSTVTPQVYDPISNAWSTTGSLVTPRDGMAVTQLKDGKILVAGGETVSATFLTTSELYDPGTGNWSSSGAIGTGRYQGAMATLSNGTVLLTGGTDSATAASFKSSELYSAGTWSATGAMLSTHNSIKPVALPNGTALIAGAADGAALSTTELYSAGAWSTKGALATARGTGSMVLLPNGKAMYSGSYVSSVYMSSVELYDPVTGTWSSGPSLNSARGPVLLAPLGNNKLIAVAGTGATGSALGTVEVAATSEYVPDSRYVPAIQALSRTVARGQTVTITGARFKGPAPDGSDHPHVFIRPLVAYGQSVVPVHPGLVDLSTYVYANASNSWSTMDTSLTLTLPSDTSTLPNGWYHVNVVTGGKWSDSRIIQVADLSGGGSGLPYTYSTTHAEAAWSTSTYVVIVATGSGNHYHYLFNTVASSRPAAADTQWDGSALGLTATTTGPYYVHVMGRNGAHAGGETNDGYADYGPIYVDSGTPSAVSTMTATASASALSVTLNWATPSDNVGIGAYRIQYAPVNNPPWDSASYNVRFTTAGTTTGQMVNYNVTGLSPNTSYYFALWSEDGSANLSAISNTPVAITTNVYTAVPTARGAADTSAETSIADLVASDVPSMSDPSAAAAADGLYTLTANDVLDTSAHTVTTLPDEPLSSVRLEGRVRTNGTACTAQIILSTSAYATSRNVTSLPASATTTFSIDVSTTAGTRTQIGLARTQYTNCGAGGAGARKQFDYLYLTAVPLSSAPAAVSNLAVSAVYTTSATLTWTSVGDDGNSNAIIGGKYRVKAASYTPYNYDVSDYTVQWSTATTPGLSSAYTITGLSSGTTYYFRLWTADEQPLFGTLSNGATGQTLTSGGGAATTVTSAGSGNWHTAGTWGGNAVPRAIDTAVIAAGHTVTSTGTVNVASITVNGILAFDASAGATPLSIASGGKLVNNGTVRIVDATNAVTIQGAAGGSATIEGSTITFNGKKLYVARVVYQPALTLLNGEALELTGPATFYTISAATGSSVIQGSGNDLTIRDGTVTFAPGTLTKDTGGGALRGRGTSTLNSGNQNVGRLKIGDVP